MTLLKSRSAVGVLEVAAAPGGEREAAAAVPAEVAGSPLYGVAMLKIAMELKKADARSLDDIVTGVLRRMGLDEAAFRDFLGAHGGLLRTVARTRSY